MTSQISCSGPNSPGYFFRRCPRAICRRQCISTSFRMSKVLRELPITRYVTQGGPVLGDGCADDGNLRLGGRGFRARHDGPFICCASAVLSRIKPVRFLKVCVCVVVSLYLCLEIDIGQLPAARRKCFGLFEILLPEFSSYTIMPQPEAALRLPRVLRRSSSPASFANFALSG